VYPRLAETLPGQLHNRPTHYREFGVSLILNDQLSTLLKTCVSVLCSSSLLGAATPAFPPWLSLSAPRRFVLRWCCSTMPPKFETHVNGVLITCVGLLASSLGVFVVRHLRIPSSISYINSPDL